MLNNEKLAIAAHLHVVLRRKTGRVTDTEWMASNVEYAAEIVRFARAAATEDVHTELAEWAAKLEQAMALEAPKPPARERIFGSLFTGARTHVPSAPAEPEATVKETGNDTHQYVRGIRWRRLSISFSKSPRRQRRSSALGNCLSQFRLKRNPRSLLSKPSAGHNKHVFSPRS